MKNIYYFTGTGNSLCIANRIAAADKGTKVSRVTKKSLLKPVLLKGKVGIVFPVYAWGAPAMLEKFLKTAGYTGVEYLYIFATYAGSERNALQSCASVIRKAGGTVNAAFSVKMGNNYIIASNTASPALAERMMQKREDQLKEMIGDAVENRNVPVKKSCSPLALLASGLVHPMFAKYYGKKVSQQFNVTDSCNSCGICVKVCPSNNVRLLDNPDKLNSSSKAAGKAQKLDCNTTVLPDKKPVWGTECEVCLACINLCPQKAILYKNSHSERIRYCNPEVKVSDLFV
ncbi:MAG: EFR1 family ferrodoxin [Spirochaetes bacterium]|nr:EFR1 family ferrodoxin [Spirochaetota bacterium]MBN2770246.1 EFR1 family ferrodoxin [Spirochaetota bacterium]